MRYLRLFIILASLLLSGCAAKRFFSTDDAGRTPESHVLELEKQLSDRQKQCAEERRKLESALREAQRRNDDTQRKLDETQRKLDAVVGIERSLRKKTAPVPRGE